MNSVQLQDVPTDLPLAGDSAPRVAVIITTYNRRDFVGEAVASVLAQSVADFELLVVDDGSTDNTEEVVRPYLQDKRVRYVSKANGGQASALNFGLARTSAPLVCFLDSDCRWLPEKLEAQLAALRDHPAVGVVYGENEVIDASGQVTGRMTMSRFSGRVVTQLLYDNFVNFNCSMIRRELLERVGAFNEQLRRNPDYDLWLRMSMVTEFLHMNRVLAQYRVMQDQLSSDRDARFASNRDILAAFLDGPGSALPAGEARRAWSGFHVRRGRYYASAGRRREAYTDIFRALKISPLDKRAWRALAAVALGRAARRKAPSVT
jgi:glycosyltransferase involved in cell wall biosynthesis